ncbi:MAG: hypothetical protein R3248_13235 [Candidatus Promineifilaceae bacterium]|nr:hypothetical protein [Candidatus Promineifilaceae bacterium]
MRIEKKKEQELAQREGLTKRTIIQVIWLLISGVIGYFIVQSLFAGGYITMEYFYRELAVPPEVPEFAIQGALVLLIVFVMQFFLIFGYVVASPQGRARSGKPTAYSSNPDPLENEYRN